MSTKLLNIEVCSFVICLHSLVTTLYACYEGRTSNGTTPLYKASVKRHLEVVKALLWAGADANQGGSEWEKERVGGGGAGRE